jgi:hypothetical protein
MIETIAKIVETSAKYAWGLLVVCIFVLFCPEKFSSQIGILEIRSQYLGYWWVLLVFSFSICIGLLMARCGQWLSARKERNEKKQRIEQGEQAVLDRLYSLNDSEQRWISYCLLKNVQTLHASQINPTANSLLSKRIVIRGSGAITSLPFTIADFVWDHLLVFREEFLPLDVENDQVAVRNLESFESGLRRLY